MALIFHTTYYVGGRPFGTEIEADDLHHAQMLTVARGLNETIESVGVERYATIGGLRQFIHDKAWSDALHEATFLSFVGMAAGVLAPHEVLGDRGLIHELTHLLEGGGDPIEGTQATIDRCRDMAKDFETRVPGWPRGAIEARARAEVLPQKCFECEGSGLSELFGEVPAPQFETCRRCGGDGWEPEKLPEASEPVQATDVAADVTQDPPAPGKAAQGVYMDQVDAVIAADAWFETVRRTIKGPTHIDRSLMFQQGGVQTLWCSSILLASAVLIRDDMNYTVLALIEHSNG